MEKCHIFIARNVEAKITLIGNVQYQKIPQNINFIHTKNSKEILLATEKTVSPKTDIFISAAAIANYSPKKYSKQKIKKGATLSKIELVKNIDIIAHIKQKHPEVFCVGFAAETENFIENGKKKLEEKNIDLIAVNDISNGKTINSDENELFVLSKNNQNFHIKK
jgi:phosphopantothenoylcysteine decarboxylase / phosphopantothenate---cysteine ligase